MKHIPVIISPKMLIQILPAVILLHHKVDSNNDCPCDIYGTGGTPCVAAHSTVRALYSSYNGPLYQVRRASDNKTKDISVTSPGECADGAAQDSFCTGTTCITTVVYDQSGKGNDLWYQGSNVVPGSPVSKPAVSSTESLNVNGHKVYSLYIKPGNSYWRDGSKTGVPVNDQPEGMYMVTSGTHYNNGCCFDYGNSETTRKADAAGAMDAINFGNQCWFGNCSGSGPWVQADLEWGLFPGGSKTWNPNQKSFSAKYVTAMLKNDGKTRFALKGANSQSGKLSTLYEGKLPYGYSPMRKQGAIILGSGGDCCKPDGGANLSEGTFYEGAITAGYPSDEIDNQVQTNIVGAGYGNGITLTQSTSKAISELSEITVNSCKRSIQFSFKAGSTSAANIKIFNLKGNTVKSEFCHTKPGEVYSYSIDTKRLPNGYYMVKIVYDSNVIHTSKVLLIK